MQKTYYLLEDQTNCVVHYEIWQEIITGLEKKGWKRAKKIKNSGIILVRHCCMTTEELDKAMKTLVDLSKQKVQGKVFLGECISRATALVEAIKAVLPNFQFCQFTTPEEFFQQLGEEFEKNSEPILGKLIDGSVVINISYGCKRKCTFCKVAYMHQEYISVPFEEILEKIQMAKQQGIKKIVIHAMNSTEYNDKGRKLSDLLKALLEIPDVIYQINGMVLAELTEETVEILQNPRFFAVQMELQSFIPAVREKMAVGVVPTEKILSIFEKMRGKMIFSNVMTGFCRENDVNFKEQLDIIEQNNLFFLSVNNLIATPGTKAAELRNPGIFQTKKRMIELIKVLTRLRKRVAEDMLGTEQNGTVFSLYPNTVVLCDNGVAVKTKRKDLEIGQRVTVIPACVISLFGNEEQNLLLSTEKGEEMGAKSGVSEEQILGMMGMMVKIDGLKNGSNERANMMSVSLQEYCRTFLYEELQK